MITTKSTRRIWNTIGGIFLAVLSVPAYGGDKTAAGDAAEVTASAGYLPSAPSTANTLQPSVSPKEPSPAAPALTPAVTAELEELKAAAQAQVKQFAAHSQELETERTAMLQEFARIASLESKLGIAPDADVSPLGLPETASTVVSQPFGGSQALAAVAQNGTSNDNGASDSPLFFKIGQARFTPGGYIDLIGTYRSANIGSGLTTNLTSIPFGNTLPAGQLSEFRFNPTGSRISLQVDADISRKTAITGYVETDFAGYQPANTDTTTNPSSLRLRQAWAQIRHGKWELLAGQTWSLLTPDRVGLSPLSADVFTASRLDTSYVAGLEFARQPGIRVTYHATDWWTFGVSAENPQQFVPSSVTFPGASSGSFFSGQFDNGSSSTSGAGATTNTITPNLAPDGIVKTALDKRLGDKLFHVEFGGIVRVFKDYDNLVTPNITSTIVGGGAIANANLELFKGFRLIINSIYGDGVGRYIGALGPDVIVKSDGSLSAVHGGGTVDGFEWQITPRILVDSYYGAAYFGRDFSKPTATTYVGYGFPGSPNTDNRTFQQGTVGFIGNVWSNPSYGRLQFIAQPAYIVRTPWAVAVGTPKNAHIFITYISLRYTLP